MEKAIEMVKSHIDEMQGRIIEKLKEKRDIEMYILGVVEERTNLESLLFKMERVEVKKTDKQDKRCGSCSHIREVDDGSRLKVRTRCIERQPNVGGFFWVEPDDEGCDKWEVMR